MKEILSNTYREIFDRSCFFLGALLISELLLQMLIYGGISWRSLPYVVLFSAVYAVAAALFCGLFRGRGGFIAMVVLHCVAALLFCTQYIYYLFFRTPLQVYSIGNAGKVTEFSGIAMNMISAHFWQMALFFLPVLALIIFWREPSRPRASWKSLLVGLGTVVLLYLAAAGLMLVTNDKSPTSAYALYYNDVNVPVSQKTLGVITTMRVDAQRTLFGFTPKDAPALVTAGEALESGEDEPRQANVMDIDFAARAAADSDEELQAMDRYFAAQEPTYQNDHTGVFKGRNLIFIVAESFYYPLLAHPELYPTLCGMARSGWSFTNYYIPLFNVSTSDGEYVSLTGLLPKSGEWSFSRSAGNYLPFVLARQFSREGYDKVLAYHDHNYAYYDRDLSHPNLGYAYKGLGNGLAVDETWPESDLQMAEASTAEYCDGSSFHVYYLTVSGHLEYSFDGNNMAARHYDEVAELPYSEPVKAYLAANIELELMLEKICADLDAAGQLENTVIALTADHYPYGLSDSAVDELVGHQVERDFELYRNGFFIWSPGLPAQNIDTLMSSLDILPTLSNLFGFTYDSRLLMGRDVFSDGERLVIFNDRSWLTDKGRYHAANNVAEGDMDEAYTSRINSIVYSKFYYSAKILERDYYRLLFGE